ncbi:MAG: acylneuraminate cytidylyltransferase family protein [Lachnospiraceae bacterium]|nr:acylneuraminate cytidylyltransferase family protein [Lachnospiraceae bacterium]
MEILGFVPARGGSKGIPGKNMKPLLGKPLMQYTFEAAKQSRYIDRLLLSTDEPSYASFGESEGVEVSMRPAELSGDDTPMKEVVRYHLEEFKKEGYEPDVFVLLQPTSPLRTAGDIDESLTLLLKDEKADSVVSVREVPHSCLPVKIMKEEEGALVFLERDGEKYTTRQALPTLYARNGPAILAFKVKSFLETGSFYGKRCIKYLMPEERSVDIDTPFDFKLVSFLMESNE